MAAVLMSAHQPLAFAQTPELKATTKTPS